MINRKKIKLQNNVYIELSLRREEEEGKHFFFIVKSFEKDK